MSSAKNRTKKKRASQAPVALVYFVTMLLFLGIIGGFAFYALKYFHVIGNDDSDNTPTTSYVSFTNLYARVDSTGKLGDAVVVKIRPTNNKILMLTLSPFTVDSSDSGKTFREIYADGGVLKLRKAVKRVYGIDIEHYATITPSAFDNCMDIFGGFSYTPKEELYYLNKKSNAGDLLLESGKTVTLSGRQIRLVATYPVFSKGYQENVAFLGTALQETLNNAFRSPTMTSDNMDNIYSILSANSETDIDEDTFKYQRSYVRSMLKENITPCQAVVPEGNWTDKTHFAPSADSVKSIKEKFAEKGNSQDSSETLEQKETDAQESK